MKKLYVAMVGLPARGKSTLARRIQSGLEQQGVRTAIFNNGDTRRRLFGVASAKSDFFDPANETACRNRRNIARLTMEAARLWLASKGDVAIIDATHSAYSQRQDLMEYLNDFPVMFVECQTRDTELLDDFIRRKAHLPEFADMPAAAALRSFRERIAHYVSVYSPLKNEPCWIRTDVTDCRILAEAPSSAIPYYSAIRSIITSRWVNNLYLVRHGETEYNLENRIGGDPALSPEGLRQAKLLARYFRGVSIPYIFTSTRLRSVQTAAPLLENRPIGTGISLEDFDELHAGLCEEMRYEDIKRTMPQEYTARTKDKYHYTYPGGESYAILQERVARGLRRALFTAGEGALMIIGHQAINRTILSLFLAHRPEDIPYLHVPQNQFYHITVTQGKKLFEMIRYA